MALLHTPTVATVLRDPPVRSLDRSERHVMAYAPLRLAPWGVAIGASESEVMVSVTGLRTVMVVFGSSAVGVLVAGLLLAIHTCQRYRRGHVR
ncbi:MAG: hypothetical protein DRJ28_05405 [Actinobacteria bacterium]|nr:MAG: hypothetical protein DRJ28_05405 [Actinomycetota bacterium]